MTGFYFKCNTRLKCTSPFKVSIIQKLENRKYKKTSIFDRNEKFTIKKVHLPDRIFPFDTLLISGTAVKETSQVQFPASVDFTDGIVCTKDLFSFATTVSFTRIRYKKEAVISNSTAEQLIWSGSPLFSSESFSAIIGLLKASKNKRIKIISKLDVSYLHFLWDIRNRMLYFDANPGAANNLNSEIH